jgi:hypothetical protein
MSTSAFWFSHWLVPSTPILRVPNPTTEDSRLRTHFTAPTRSTGWRWRTKHEEDWQAPGSSPQLHKGWWAPCKATVWLIPVEGMHSSSLFQASKSPRDKELHLMESTTLRLSRSQSKLAPKWHLVVVINKPTPPKKRNVFEAAGLPKTTHTVVAEVNFTLQICICAPSSSTLCEREPSYRAFYLQCVFWYLYTWQ